MYRLQGLSVTLARISVSYGIPHVLWYSVHTPHTPLRENSDFSVREISAALVLLRQENADNPPAHNVSQTPLDLQNRWALISNKGVRNCGYLIVFTYHLVRKSHKGRYIENKMYVNETNIFVQWIWTTPSIAIRISQVDWSIFTTIALILFNIQLYWL